MKEIQQQKRYNIWKLKKKMKIGVEEVSRRGMRKKRCCLQPRPIRRREKDGTIAWTGNERAQPRADDNSFLNRTRQLNPALHTCTISWNGRRFTWKLATSDINGYGIHATLKKKKTPNGSFFFWKINSLFFA